MCSKDFIYQTIKNCRKEENNKTENDRRKNIQTLKALQKDIFNFPLERENREELMHLLKVSIIILNR